MKFIICAAAAATLVAGAANAQTVRSCPARLAAAGITTLVAGRSYPFEGGHLVPANKDNLSNVCTNFDADHRELLQVQEQLATTRAQLARANDAVDAFRAHDYFMRHPYLGWGFGAGELAFLIFMFGRATALWGAPKSKGGIHSMAV